jgi:protein gp37
MVPAIEWTDATWNPVIGWTKTSPRRENCYAARFSEPFRGVPGHPFETGFDPTAHPERLLQPFAWNQPRMILVRHFGRKPPSHTADRSPSARQRPVSCKQSITNGRH